jgi:hypothetical protein
MKQQAPAPIHQQQNGYGVMSGGYGMGRFGGSGFQQPMGFGGMNGTMVAQPMQGKQRVQEAATQFDEAAFEQAFAQVDQDMVEDATATLHSNDFDNYHPPPTTLEQQNKASLLMDRQMQDARQEAKMEQNTIMRDLSEGEGYNDARTDDPVLLRIREQRPGKSRSTRSDVISKELTTTSPAVYATLKLRSGVDLDSHQDAMHHLALLEKMEQANLLAADASEARWIVDTLQNMLERGNVQEVQTRTETLIRAINERLMSTYPLMSSMSTSLNQEHLWEELQAAGYTREQHVQRQQNQQLHREPQQAEPEQKEQQSLLNDDDEMADTAGKLLERVADNTSTKFQNSQFLELMRKLRDREVKVEGDKMVEVSAQSSSPPFQQAQHEQQRAPAPVPPYQQSGASSAIPGIDPTILSHADTNFSLPVFSEEGHDEYAPVPLARQPSSSSSEPLTDEISDQYSYYNIHAAYHK